MATKTKKATKKTTAKKVTAKKATKRTAKKATKKVEEKPETIKVKGREITIAPNLPEFMRKNLLKWHHTSSPEARTNFHNTRQKKIKKDDVGSIGNQTDVLDNLTVG